MNIFVLSQDPFEAARQHCDKHVVKMVLEYAQLLSTAHRVLDGAPQTIQLENGKTITRLLLEGEGVSFDPVGGLTISNQRVYKETHINHPCAKWVRETSGNYEWLYQLLVHTLNEYSVRYKRRHSICEMVNTQLKVAPRNIKQGLRTQFVQAMPDEHKSEDPVEAYRRFYVKEKARFARWTKPGTPPNWFTSSMEGQDVSRFSRPAR